MFTNSHIMLCPQDCRCFDFLVAYIFTCPLTSGRLATLSPRLPVWSARAVRSAKNMLEQKPSQSVCSPSVYILRSGGRLNRYIHTHAHTVVRCARASVTPRGTRSPIHAHARCAHRVAERGLESAVLAGAPRQLLVTLPAVRTSVGRFSVSRVRVVSLSLCDPSR